MAGRKVLDRWRIPLVNGGKLCPQAISDFARQAVTKPQSYLGAPFVADKVALRKTVMLCEACWRKYYGWWRREDYRGDWDMRYRSHCDGCSAHLVETSMFVPEDLFHTVLAPDCHGKLSEPRRRLFS